MNTRGLLQTAVILRVFETIGLLGKEAVPFKTKQLHVVSEDNKKIWAGKINADASSFVLLVYIEFNDVKCLASTLVVEDKPPAELYWYFAICGDETGENIDVNRIVAEMPIKESKETSNFAVSKTADRFISEVSCYDICGYLKGFELIRSFMAPILPTELDESVIKKVLNIQKIIVIEDENEEDDDR
jgi:hypothetical protein